MYIIDKLHGLLYLLVDIGAIYFELSGIFILLLAGIRGLIDYIKKDRHIRLNLSKRMAFGLELILGGEILKTIVVKDFQELAVVAGVALLRAALSLLIHWEIKTEEAELSLASKKDLASDSVLEKMNTESKK